MSTTMQGAAPLAIDGGPQVRTRPMPVRKLIGERERAAVVDLLNRAIAEGSHLLAYQGEQETAYCREFAEMLGGGFADCVSSGTNAVFVALAALELEPLSEVVVPPISDPGGVMPVGLLGCVPIAADSAPGSFNTAAAEIEKVLTPRTKAILIAHISGLSVEMGPIMEIARKRGIPVIEDCAQAHGAKHRGKPCGTFGDIAVFSTMFGKHHATGGQGGVVFTRSEELYRKVRRYADRGKPFGIEGQTQNVVCSLNFNMDELHAAIGRVSLSRLPKFVAQRRRIAHRMADGCRALRTVRAVTEHEGDEGSYWFLLLRLDLEKLRTDRDTFTRAVAAEGIPCSAGYPFFPTRMPWANDRCPACRRAAPCELPDCCLRTWRMPELPNARAADAVHCRISIHEGWTDADADDVVAAVKKVEQAYMSR